MPPTEKLTRHINSAIENGEGIPVVAQKKLLRDATRAEFAAFINARPGLHSTPHEAKSLGMAVMQFTDDVGLLVAQAIYNRGLAPRYQIEDSEEPEEPED